MALKDYSTTPANNNAAPPNGAPEGMAAAGVNNTQRQFRADVKDGVSLKIDTKALMSALDADKLSEDSSVFMVSRATTDDGGGGIFRVTKTDISTQVTADTEEGVYVPFDSDATGLSGGFVRNDIRFADPAWYGTIGDGSTDDTTALQAAFDAGPVFINKSHAVTGVTTTDYVTMLPDSRLIYTGAQNGLCLGVGASFGDLYVDGGLNDVSGVQITEDIDGKFVYVERITASATSSTSIFPFSTNATNEVYVERVQTFNTKNTGQSNASFPQAVAFVGSSDNTRIGSVFCEDGASGVASNSGTHFVTSIHCKNMTDNGVYGLGADFYIEDFIYEGTEEAYVATGGRHNVGRITTIGKCIGALELQSNGDVHVDQIVILDDGAGSDTCSKVIIDRASSTTIGRIYVGSITGTIKGNGIVALNTATSVEYLQIDNIDVTLLYDASFSGGWQLNAWFDITSVEKFNIRNSTIRIRDINNTIVGTTNFIVQFGTPTTESLAENFDVFFETSTGADLALADCRIGPQNEFLAIKGAVWQVNVGPFAREANFLGGFRDSAASVPTGGFWRQGQLLWHGDLTGASPFAFACSVTGTPGTWISLNAP